MADIRRFIAPGVQARTVYHVAAGEPAIKLDAMENPYRLPMELRDRWLYALRDLALNRYPSPEQYERVKARLARDAGLAPHTGVILGNGSDEILQNILLALDAHVTVVAPTPTFVMYEQIAAILGRRFVGVPLLEDFALDVPAVADALTRHAPAILFLAYPNNPTGTLYPAEAMRALLDIDGAAIVVDEAYYPFAQASLITAVEDRPQLLVVRTLSKQGFAGLRFGWLAADRAWTDELDKVRLPYNVSVVTAASVDFALDYADVFADQALRIRAERTRLYEALSALVTVWPSEANFLLFRPPVPGDAARIHARLMEAGILIKNLAAAGGALTGCLRVTVGTPAENDAFLAALAQAL
ncbi:aminotransferase class I/II-fold pyridoxal phosphate-dependent enzyme [Acidiferrobacter sp.]|uniref:pyridoxal phosphate-dependent aminotransferase n=1 Tax=Acidiferrobacter sp. TaxID=1872107 RepID=UPI00260A211E|nr:aminotransferase class I/II-fold pyridoxal phosphate-dependent enzyme [Acidiferrobacter sp.]